MNNVSIYIGSEKPDLEAAAAALNAISNITPDIIRGTVEKIEILVLKMQFSNAIFFNLINKL